MKLTTTITPTMISTVVKGIGIPAAASTPQMTNRESPISMASRRARMALGTTFTEATHRLATV